MKPYSIAAARSRELIMLCGRSDGRHGERTVAGESTMVCTRHQVCQSSVSPNCPRGDENSPWHRTGQLVRGRLGAATGNKTRRPKEGREVSTGRQLQQRLCFPHDHPPSLSPARQQHRGSGRVSILTRKPTATPLISLVALPCLSPPLPPVRHV